LLQQRQLSAASSRLSRLDDLDRIRHQSSRGVHRRGRADVARLRRVRRPDQGPGRRRPRPARARAGPVTPPPVLTNLFQDRQVRLRRGFPFVRGAQASSAVRSCPSGVAAPAENAGLGSTRNGRGRGSQRKKLTEIGELCPLANELFRPRPWTGRVLALRPGSGDRPVRVWAQGSRARRAERQADPPLPTSPLHHAVAGKAGMRWARRGRAAASGGLRATRAPGPRRRGRRACAPPAGAA
jgi:hypothetical protein